MIPCTITVSVGCLGCRDITVVGGHRLAVLKASPADLVLPGLTPCVGSAMSYPACARPFSIVLPPAYQAWGGVAKHDAPAESPPYKAASKRLALASPKGIDIWLMFDC